MKMLRPIVKYLSDTYLINLSIRCLENEERLFNYSLRGTKNGGEKFQKSNSLQHCFFYVLCLASKPIIKEVVFEGF